MRGRWFAKGLAFLVLIAAVAAVVSFVVMVLWNALIPSLFAGPVLRFWQAAGLLALSRLLFGGLRGHGWRRHRHHRWWYGRWERMTPQERERFHEGIRRWRDMTREERGEFRKGFAGRCGRGWNDGLEEQAKET